MWRAAVTHSEAREAHLHQRSEQPAALHCTLVLRRRAGGLPACRHKASHAGRPHARRSLLAGRQELLLRRHAGRGPHGAAGRAGLTAHHRRLLLHWLHWLPLLGGRLVRDTAVKTHHQAIKPMCVPMLQATSDAWQLPQQQQCRRRQVAIASRRRQHARLSTTAHLTCMGPDGMPCCGGIPCCGGMPGGGPIGPPGMPGCWCCCRGMPEGAPMPGCCCCGGMPPAGGPGGWPCNADGGRK